MFICDMVLRCTGTLKAGFKSGPVTADLTTTVVHIYDNVQSVHSLTPPVKKSRPSTLFSGSNNHSTSFTPPPSIFPHHTAILDICHTMTIPTVLC